MHFNHSFLYYNIKEFLEYFILYKIYILNNKIIYIYIYIIYIIIYYNIYYYNINNIYNNLL